MTDEDSLQSGIINIIHYLGLYTDPDQIVEKCSALPKAARRAEPVNDDHRTMCKFELDSDNTFERVSPTKEQACLHTPPSLSDILYNPSSETPQEDGAEDTGKTSSSMSCPASAFYSFAEF